jgi:hypothetical protein
MGCSENTNEALKSMAPPNAQGAARRAHAGRRKLAAPAKIVDEMSLMPNRLLHSRSGTLEAGG